MAEGGSRAGKAIQILKDPRTTGSSSESGKKAAKSLELDFTALRGVLCHSKIGKRKIALISVAGAFGTGKSFLLNFFLRYLQRKGYENEDWLGKEDIDPSDGFAWLGGHRVHTIGVWIWSDPIIVKKADGNEIAVVLLDTQGNFDTKSGKKRSAQAFELSLLLSSTFILNIRSNLQESDLEHLQFCSGITKMAMDGNCESGSCPFQNLMFLVRDWNDEEGYGIEKGAEYCKDFLDDDEDSDEDTTLSRIRTDVKSTFDTINCYLLPDPGDNVTKKKRGYTFTGRIEDIRPEFIEHVKAVCDLFLSPENLTAKRELDGTGLLHYIVRIHEHMKNNKEKFLDARTHWEFHLEALMSTTKRECVGKFTKKMAEVTSKGFIHWGEFRQHFKNIQKEVMDQFVEQIPVNDQKYAKKWILWMEEQLAIEYKCYRNVNEISELTMRENFCKLALTLVNTYEENMEQESNCRNIRVFGETHKKHKKEAMDNFQSKVSKFAWYEEARKLLSDDIECTKEWCEFQVSLEELNFDDGLCYWQWKIILESIDMFKKLGEAGISQGAAGIQSDAKAAVMENFEKRSFDFSNSADEVKKAKEKLTDYFHGNAEKKGSPAIERLHREYDDFIQKETSGKIVSLGALELMNKEFTENALEVYKSRMSDLSGSESITMSQWISEQNKASTWQQRKSEIMQATAKIELHECKTKLLAELVKYADEIFIRFMGDSLLDEKHKDMRERFGLQSTELAKKHYKVPEQSGFNDDILGVLNSAFAILKKRDENRKHYAKVMRDSELKKRTGIYLNKMNEVLGESYLLPAELEKVHRELVENILRDIPEELRKSDRKEIEDQLTSEYEAFKIWNERNKFHFKKIFGISAASLTGTATVAAGAAAVGVYTAEIVGLAAAGAIAGTGVGLAVLGGVLVVGAGTAVFLKWRKKRMKKYFSDKSKELSEKLPGHCDPTVIQ